MHRAYTQSIGNNLGTDTAGTVVNHEGVTDAGQYIVEYGIIGKEPRECLCGSGLAVIHRGEVAKSFEAVRQRWITFAHTFQRIRAGPFKRIIVRANTAPATISVRTRYDCVQVCV